MSSGGFGAAAPCGLADEELLAWAVAGEALLRCAEGVVVEAAGELAERSKRELGVDRLTVKHGCTDVVSLISGLTGVSKKTAAARVRLGTAVRSSMSMVGLVNESNFPSVHEALREGRLAVDSAQVITRMLGDSARRVGFGADLHECERMVVLAADPTTDGLGLSADQVAVMVAQWQGHLDPDGAEPTARELEDKRGLWLRQQVDGSFKVGGVLTAVQGAKWQAIAQTILSPRIPTFTGNENESADGSDEEVSPVLVDGRSREQLLADGFTAYIDRVAGLPGMPVLGGARPTINVHVSLEDVVDGRGVGWVDGVDLPVPVATVDQLICHGEVISTVMHAGRVLQHGKTKRLFTAAQNRALAARDGGCVWPGCGRPPSWCETHHVLDWRDKGYLPGRTDVDNGVLLCHFHHSNVHKSRWKLVMITGAPHIIPPPEIDWTQTPRPCTGRRTRQ